MIVETRFDWQTNWHTHQVTDDTSVATRLMLLNSRADKLCRVLDGEDVIYPNFYRSPDDDAFSQFAFCLFYGPWSDEERGIIFDVILKAQPPFPVDTYNRWHITRQQDNQIGVFRQFMPRSITVVANFDRLLEHVDHVLR